MWYSGDIRGTSQGFVCRYGFCSGYLGHCCLLLGTSCTAGGLCLVLFVLLVSSCLIFHLGWRGSLECFSYAGPGLSVVIRYDPIISFVLARVIISLGCSIDAGPGLSVVIRHDAIILGLWGGARRIMGWCRMTTLNPGPASIEHPSEMITLA